MLSDLKKLLVMRRNDIEAWFELQWKDLAPPLYLSCDIRHSGFKIAPVDTNLFPAGFNNLCNTYSRELTKALGDHFEKFYPGMKKVLIYAEEHTRNKFYLKNLGHLSRALEATGKNVAIGVLGSFLPESPFTVNLEQEKITLHRLERDGNAIRCGSFIPDLIISNNDFSESVPEILEGISQPVIPDTHLGWHRRKKEDHFRILKEVSNHFGRSFSVDPWLIHPLTEVCSQTDIGREADLERMVRCVEKILEATRLKYAEYHVNETPYVYLKNNRGTYGMGILPVFSGEEVLTLSRRKKNKLLSSKGNIPPTDFLIQEGIPTVDFYSGYPIEPVIYAVGRNPVGGFFRIHESKNALESLNAPGMTFSCLCLHKLNEPHENIFLDCKQKEDVVELSRFVTRLAILAAAKE